MIPHLIPLPKNITCNPETVALSPALYCGCEDFLPAAEVFVKYASALTGKSFSLCADPGTNGGIHLALDNTLAPESYTLTAEKEITLTAASAVGINHALATLLQLIDPAACTIPSCRITDQPDCQFRGCMIDLARNWHDFNLLLDYVDMCWFYKIPMLHLHFTDDQSYTLPSRIYPNLSTENRHYSLEQIRQLTDYAAARGVELIPEIDVPGHCTSFSESYPELFGHKIITQTAASMAAMKALFTELCELFPHSRYIHIGGDEAAILAWGEDENCRSYVEALGIDFDMPDKKQLSERLLANFVQQMADAVFACGRIPLAWEGFAECVNQYVSKDILLFSWENYYQTAPQLLDGGFRIINGSWNPMYIVTPTPCWSQEEVFNWTIYDWTPVHPGSPYIGSSLHIEPDDQIIGGWLLAWGDKISSEFETVAEGVLAEQALVEERAPLLSENTWHVQKVRSYSDIKTAYDALCGKLTLLKKADR